MVFYGSQFYWCIVHYVVMHVTRVPLWWDANVKCFENKKFNNYRSLTVWASKWLILCFRFTHLMWNHCPHVLHDTHQVRELGVFILQLLIGHLSFSLSSCACWRRLPLGLLSFSISSCPHWPPICCTGPFSFLLSSSCTGQISAPKLASVDTSGGLGVEAIRGHCSSSSESEEISYGVLMLHVDNLNLQVMTGHS